MLFFRHTQESRFPVKRNVTFSFSHCSIVVTIYDVRAYVKERIPTVKSENVFQSSIQ